jgi:ATP-dependent DNA ligase
LLICQRRSEPGGPELVAQIEFTEWTPDEHLRHSKFVGMREDKEARELCEGYAIAVNKDAPHAKTVH